MARIVRRNSNYIVHLKKEIEIVAKEAGVDVQTTVDVLDNFFVTLRVFLADPRLPTIRIGKFGYFQTTYGGIRKSLFAALASYKKDPTLEKRSIFWDKFYKIWKIRNRILMARRGESDGIDWKNVDPKTFLEDEKVRIFKDKYSEYYTEDGKRIDKRQELERD